MKVTAKAPEYMRNGVAAIIMNFLDDSTPHQTADKVIWYIRQFGEAEPIRDVLNVALSEKNEDGARTITVTMIDGAVKHVIVGEGSWLAGQPRPTEPCVYQDPKNLTHIYTLFSNGTWTRNSLTDIHVPIRLVPEGLEKIA